MPSNQKQIIEQAKFKIAFEKQTKTIEEQWEKQVGALKTLESSNRQLSSMKTLYQKKG